MDNIELKLSLDEVNNVLEALGNMPYVKVYQLVQKIQSQANQQVSSSAPSPVRASRES